MTVREIGSRMASEQKEMLLQDAEIKARKLAMVLASQPC